MNFREYIQQGFVFLDGATGSNLQEHGMQAGECPELWILNHPDVFVELQKQYILSGSDVLYAPTFTCSLYTSINSSSVSVPIGYNCSPVIVISPAM